MKKIVILGPESTGKSTLCTQLAMHYQTSWVPEFARQYLLDNGMNYTYDDLLIIAKGQVASEDEMTRHKQVNELLFLDTDMYVMKVWCEYVFKKCHAWILEQISRRKYDMYLLCNVDLPWVKDELREYPDLKHRLALYEIYKNILNHQHVPWAEISGSYETRLHMATNAINQLSQ
ncbi:MAG: ATP-binding protein [Chitinophagaceae bacterium]